MSKKLGLMLLSCVCVVLICISVCFPMRSLPVVASVLEHVPAASKYSAGLFDFASRQYNDLAVGMADKDDFLSARGYFEKSAEYSQKASVISSDYGKNALKIRENYALMMLRWGNELLLSDRVDEASETLNLANRLAPGGGLILIRLGDLASELNLLTQAESYYEQAMDADGSDLVKDYALNQMIILRDEIEIGQRQNFLRYGSAELGFVIEAPRYEGAVNPDLLIQWFDECHTALRKRFDLSTSRPLYIRIYEEVDFAGLADAPLWATAAFDNRLRLNYTKLGVSELDVADTVWHEYTHVVLERTSRVKLPVWFQEGFAQYMEPYNTYDERERDLMGAKVTSKSLEQLGDNSFADIDDRHEAEQAYLVSKYFVKYLGDTFGDAGFTRLLRAVRGGLAFDAAFERVYGAEQKTLFEGWASALDEEQKKRADR